VDYLAKSNALEKFWRRPITAQQLQAEMDRMSTHTRDGEMLQELYRALGNDSFVIAETLARQTLADRLIRNWYGGETRPNESFEAWWDGVRGEVIRDVAVPSAIYTVATVSSTVCASDSWTPTRFQILDGRYGHTAVWTGTEMIVWGGSPQGI